MMTAINLWQNHHYFRRIGAGNRKGNLSTRSKTVN
jgi:hypothetical protein